ncbi:hypothetical protein AVEN_234627-1 [Araneus ventricosus]|uniref:Uncharacterized protein n=1 Tax=Araneus ventricosus TaxID=182803 RepID=A0A4Y2UTA7_ARAVE|nr:hypothetical protein AVEN_234627-1 [Araneus ventricosus]
MSLIPGRLSTENVRRIDFAAPYVLDVRGERLCGKPPIVLLMENMQQITNPPMADTQISSQEIPSLLKMSTNFRKCLPIQPCAVAVNFEQFLRKFTCVRTIQV